MVSRYDSEEKLFSLEESQESKYSKHSEDSDETQVKKRNEYRDYGYEINNAIYFKHMS